MTAKFQSFPSLRTLAGLPEMGRKELCSFCCDYHRKHNPLWGIGTVVEVPGCEDCHTRYETHLGELEAKLASMQKELDESTRLKVEANCKAELLTKLHEIEKSKLTAELNELKPFYQLEQRKSKFLKVGQDTGVDGDVTVSVEGLDISAHRAILADKSPVFKKFLEGRTLESQIWTIQDDRASYPVMEAVIKFCYTGEISFKETVTPDETLKIAHEYKIEYLKSVCETELCRRMSVENLPHLLKLSRTYAASKLEEKAEELFKDNFDALKDIVFGVLEDTATAKSLDSLE